MAADRIRVGGDDARLERIWDAAVGMNLSGPTASTDASFVAYHDAKVAQFFTQLGDVVLIVLGERLVACFQQRVGADWEPGSIGNPASIVVGVGVSVEEIVSVFGEGRPQVFGAQVAFASDKFGAVATEQHHMVVVQKSTGDAISWIALLLQTALHRHCRRVYNDRHRFQRTDNSHYESGGGSEQHSAQGGVRIVDGVNSSE